MGFKIAWIACRDRSLEAMIDALDMRLTGERDDFPEAEFSALQSPSGWALIVNSFGGDAAFLLEGLDEPIRSSGEVLACYINETTMMSQLGAHRDGALTWSVTHDCERGPDNLDVVGTPPREFETIRERQMRRQADETGSDHVFEIAPDLGEALTGFHHAKDVEAPFETLGR